MYDPTIRQFARKEVTHFSNQMRNKLQMQARDIEIRAWRLLSNKSAQVNGVSELIGEIEGYIVIRRLLSPDVGQDGYTGQLKGLIHKLKFMRDAAEK
jgi:hypothetical protein